MPSNLDTVALIMIVGSLVCGAGAWYADTYAQYINIGGFFGTISRYPYQQYVFPLSFFAVFLFVVGIVAAVAASAHARASAIPTQLVEKCPHCGFQLPPRSRFCPSCGRVIEQENWKRPRVRAGARVLYTYVTKNVSGNVNRKENTYVNVCVGAKSYPATTTNQDCATSMSVLAR